MSIRSYRNPSGNAYYNFNSPIPYLYPCKGLGTSHERFNSGFSRKEHQ